MLVQWLAENDPSKQQLANIESTAVHAGTAADSLASTDKGGGRTLPRAVPPDREMNHHALSTRIEGNDTHHRKAHRQGTHPKAHFPVLDGNATVNQASKRTAAANVLLCEPDRLQSLSGTGRPPEGCPSPPPPASKANQVRIDRDVHSSGPPAAWGRGLIARHSARNSGALPRTS